MKLPEYNRTQAQGSQTLSPSQAAAPHLAKIKLTEQVASVALELDDRKKKSDTARINALYVDDVSTKEADIASKEVLTREEIIAYGVDPADASIEWTDANGDEKQLFKRYEVETAVMNGVYNSSLKEYSSSLDNSAYKTAWLDETGRRNSESLVKITKRSASSAKQFEFKSAIASLEALSTSPQAQLDFAKTSPALDGSPDVRAKYVNQARAALYATDVNDIINNGTDADIEKRVDKMKDPETRAKIPATEKQIRILQTRAERELDMRERERDLAEGKALKLSKEQEAERNKIASEKMEGYTVAKELGMTVNEEEELKVKGAVAGTDYQAQFDMLNDVEEFAVQSITDKRAEMDRLDNGTIDNASRYKAYASSMVKTQKAARDNGYMLGVSQELIDFEPVSIGDPTSVETRIEQAEFLSGHYGERVSPFTPVEVAAFSNDLPNMTVPEQAQMANTFKSTPSVWEQFAKSGQEVFAWVGAAGVPELTDSALSGQKKIDSGDVIPPPSKDLLLASNEYLGDVYGTENKSAVMETATAIYADKAPVGNEGDFDPDAWEEALVLATGGIDEVNGFKVVIPRDTSTDLMQDYVDEFSAEDVRALGGVLGMTDEAAAVMIRDRRWVSEGDGEYSVDKGNASLMSPQGGPFIITYGQNEASDQAAGEAALRRQTRQNRLTNSEDVYKSL